MIKKVRKFFIVFLFLPFTGYSNASVSDSSLILPKINYINNQLNYITIAIGKNEPRGSKFGLKNTSKRELYYALLALYDKVNRFNFEVTGVYIAPPKNINEVKYKDINLLLGRIIEMIDQSKENLKINNQPFDVGHSVSRFDIDKSFNKVIYANIQIEISFRYYLKVK
ncbi:hypothetical protein [Francisella adeliensis]|uniref:Uncharacterized protein n=1 Tax=Francisella adeliensis TaxID=2007306 RepID=A0A2Z4XZW3_9GAMM|nr:hypothetical protein [Francisella adeliensis]AXA33983.1 hypothetical protein CDH04_05920 [Francisella adeliensis]MBK2085892.1 hypothetical protein [Francisella adeliensis]MBK2097770.1 hypothetical protein [Francisella adeliensis]QIW12219.1 hypothetical protein FZC43_05925 [Francisella adeliensis]QIW14095.1 hypothetical protein FZC44_05925 [Francisella adeliensis]